MGCPERKESSAAPVESGFVINYTLFRKKIRKAENTKLKSIIHKATNHSRAGRSSGWSSFPSSLSKGNRKQVSTKMWNNCQIWHNMMKLNTHSDAVPWLISVIKVVWNKCGIITRVSCNCICSITPRWYNQMATKNEELMFLLLFRENCESSWHQFVTCFTYLKLHFNHFNCVLFDWSTIGKGFSLKYPLFLQLISRFSKVGMIWEIQKMSN